MKYYVIIVAGGSGSRMHADVPKQFLLLKGRPVLMHTIEAFHYSDHKPEIVLVLNAAFHDYWKKICDEYSFSIECTLVSNGEQRFHSVKNGLKFIDENSIVAVHDAVRPIVSNALITRSYELARDKAAIIPVVTSKDSVRIQEGDTTLVVNRDNVLLVQTPQVFQSGLLKKAYLQEYHSGFTDDASVVEMLGERIHLTEGEYKNIKITFPEDLEIAEIFCNIRK